MTRQHPTHRIAAIAAIAVATMALLAPAASAHNLGGDLAHYDSPVLSVTPPVDGLRVTTSTGGEYLNLTNTGPHTIIVEGYKGEPYLKITKDRVWENQRSESTYLNTSLFGDALSNGKDLGNPNNPDWKQVANRGFYKYHDHRIHWMGLDRPPVVKNDPSHNHLIAKWKVHLLSDGQPITINGELRWLAIKPTNMWVYLGPIIGVSVLLALFVLIIRHRRIKAARANPTTITETEPSTV